MASSEELTYYPANITYDKTCHVVGRTYQKFDPVLISLIKRVRPQLISNSILGVQPMTSANSSIFSLRSKYSGAWSNTTQVIIKDEIDE